MANKESSEKSSKRERPRSIEDALRVLDEALASPGADLKEMVTDEFQNLNSAITNSTQQVKSQVSRGMADGMAGAFDFANTVRDTFQQGINTVASSGCLPKCKGRSIK